MKESQNPESFVIKIIDCQNSTWQGTVTWVNKDDTQGFRSALELIKMIDSVLEGNNRDFAEQGN